MPSQSKQNRIVQILEQSFAENKAVNFAVKRGGANTKGRIVMMHYAIWNAENFGKIIFSQEQDAVALLIDSRMKKYGFTALIQDLRLVINSIGIFGVRKVLNREKAVKILIPKVPHIYLWFIGVAPEAQGKGRGGEVLNEVVKYANAQKLPVYLVTSTERNFNFYERHGFSVVGTYTDQHFTSRVYVSS